MIWVIFSRKKLNELLLTLPDRLFLPKIGRISTNLFNLFGRKHHLFEFDSSQINFTIWVIFSRKKLNELLLTLPDRLFLPEIGPISTNLSNIFGRI
jgi:hypothetical protein